MIKINLNQDIVDYSVSLVDKYNFGQRGKDDGNKIEQYVGVISENTVRSYLGFNLIQPKGFDGGYDILYNGLKLDIKSMNRTVDPKPEYINNVFDVQIKYNCDGYIFTSLNKKDKTLTICGWITKKDFINKAILYKKGTIRNRGGSTFKLKADNWEILNSQLNKIRTNSDNRK